ncbi:MAG: phosphodiester glycosidase family protein [Candidatus Levybacteria bacterium]|nr:phosphodiester glycosidase family protein [Candidatus Levybacteria bacterium]
MKLSIYLKSIIKQKIYLFVFVLIVLMSALLLLQLLYYSKESINSKTKISSLLSDGNNLKKKLAEREKELIELKNQDQYKRNEDLQTSIQKIEATYKKAVTSYEKLLDLKTQSKNTAKFDDLFTKGLTYLSQKNYASGDATLNNLNKLIDDEKAKTALTFIIPETVKASNAPPNRGYSRQSVNSDIGTYLVDIIAADLNTTRVIVDTASDSDCSNDCPVLSLGDYVSRNGAFAGVNGSYFCPAEYPSCAGKTNSFDTLLMNKNKKYLNSDNNKYSNVPLIYFSGNSAGVRGQSLDWGRDTGVDMVLANQGLLLSGGNIAFGGDGDPKKGSKGSRSFVGNKGTTAYIGVVYNATVAESAYVLKTLGLENALNLDSGGSTALWSSGYKAGPGRNIPNAVLFVGK